MFNRYRRRCATFTVPGGVIEVATSQYGLRRMHYRTDSGAEHLLRPHPRTQEGLRARFGRRFPRTDAVIGVAAVVVLLVVATVGLLQGIDAITHIPLVAQHTGVFTTPISLSTGARTALGVAAALAGAERALTFRSRWLIGRRPASTRPAREPTPGPEDNVDEQTLRRLPESGRAGPRPPSAAAHRDRRRDPLRRG